MKIGRRIKGKIVIDFDKIYEKYGDKRKVNVIMEGLEFDGNTVVGLNDEHDKHCISFEVAD